VRLGQTRRPESGSDRGVKEKEELDSLPLGREKEGTASYLLGKGGFAGWAKEGCFGRRRDLYSS